MNEISNFRSYLSLPFWDLLFWILYFGLYILGLTLIWLLSFFSFDNKHLTIFQGKNRIDLNDFSSSFRALGRAWDGLAWSKEACTEVRNLGLLERKQAKVCRATLDVMPSLVQAAKDTSTVCQQAFRNRRWNCSSIDRAPDYTSELLAGINNFQRKIFEILKKSMPFLAKYINYLTGKNYIH